MFTDLTKKGLKKLKSYHSWVEVHCRVHTYSFQIKKCDDRSCCNSSSDINIPWLPDPQFGTVDHYKSFSEVVSTVTNDDERPSAKPAFKGTDTKAADKDKRKSNPSIAKRKRVLEPQVNLDPYEAPNISNLCIAQNAQALVECVECRNPRPIYSKHRLTHRQHTILTLLIADYEYSCGAPILPPNHSLAETCNVRINITCADPVEIAYYGTGFGRTDICPYCLAEDVQINSDNRKKFKTVIEVCVECLQNGIQAICYRPYGKQ